MKKELKGFLKIFKFTFRQQVRKKGFLISIVLVSLLCLLGPSLTMTGVAYFEKDSEPENQQAAQEQIDQQEYEEAAAALKKILVVNSTGEKAFSGSAMGDFDFEEVTTESLQFIDCGEDFNRAREEAKGTDDTLILLAEKQGTSYTLHLLIPEQSKLPELAADAVSPMMISYGDMVTAQINSAAGVEEDGGNPFGIDMAQDSEDDPMAGSKAILGFLIPYLNIMVLYFFVLIYGQGVAQSVIAEKNSKLMEFFLVSVRPTAMILGKMTAVCFSGALQLSVWILSLVGGFALGCAGVRMVDPDTDMMLVQLLGSFGSMTQGMFSIGGIVLTLLMVLAGMLLYCSLAGIGGAVAGKPEDLSSTNVVFTLILIASFFGCLASGGLNGLSSGSAWLDWIPFTSIMVTPSRILLGSVSLLKGLGCMLVVLATTLLLSVAGGRLYKTMVLYRGDLPGPKKLLEMLRD